jgi:hypothetical protein
MPHLEDVSRRRDSLRHHVVAFVTVLALGTAMLVVRGPTTDSAAAEKQKPLKPTPWEKTLLHTPKRGVLSKKAALRLFEMSFGDVPGVKAPDLRKPAPSGTPAILAVRAHFDEYTPKQQRAITRLLQPAPGGRHLHRAARRSGVVTGRA